MENMAQKNPLRNIRFGTILLAIWLLLVPEAMADRVYYKGFAQGTRYDLVFVDGMIDPADPDRGYVMLDLMTVRRVDVILTTRAGVGKDTQRKFKGKRINATTGTPKKEHLIFYLDNLGLEPSKGGLLAVILRFSLPGLNQTQAVAYRSNGIEVRFREVEIPIQ